MKFDRPVGSNADLTDEEQVALREECEAKEEQNYTITPQNVNDLAARLTFLLNPRSGIAVLPVDFEPSDSRCGIEMRIYTVFRTIYIELENKQVFAILSQAHEAACELVLSILDLDMMKMESEDGTDPRVCKPEDI